MSVLARDDALGRYSRVRARTESLVEGLSPEDCGAQAFTEASPAKWHLAHTTWFFETFLLAPVVPAYRPFDPAFRMLFNSYYDAVGARPLQSRRGLLTRPSMAVVCAYRQAVDRAMGQLLAAGPGALPDGFAALLELGLSHEEQHQELILTDGLALFARNPLEPAWRRPRSSPTAVAFDGPEWIGHDGGIVEIGHGGSGFAQDNEGPRHQVLLRPFRLAARPVTNAQWLAFMTDGGYRRPTLWQSDGWDQLTAQGWQAPEYWRREADGGWTSFTLYGRQPVDPEAPVCHVSWYEAEAYAAWAGARLPREEEWEAVAQGLPLAGNFLESGALRPMPPPPGKDGPLQMFGDVWEWTSSPHQPYPGWRPPQGAFGEYNGKFMSGRMVCRGGSFATPTNHMRASYRNFWWPSARWQFTGLRLAEDA